MRDKSTTFRHARTGLGQRALPHLEPDRVRAERNTCSNARRTVAVEEKAARSGLFLHISPGPPQGLLRTRYEVGSGSPSVGAAASTASPPGSDTDAPSVSDTS